MQPTEGEIQVAMEAAAKRVYDETRNQIAAASDGILPLWEDLDQGVRNVYLDGVNSAVWAALQALPDRTQFIRDLLSGAPSPMQFITDVRRFLA